MTKEKSGKKGTLSRRAFLSSSVGSVLALSMGNLGSKKQPQKDNTIAAPHIRSSKTTLKALVLGLDGMDPNLLRQFVAEGHMPTFKKLIDKGSFSLLRTTNPPQSPVAWASFITGADPGTHGIFDFVHRDPKTIMPYMSTAKTHDSGRSFSAGGWDVPMGSGDVELMRRGTPLWDTLGDYGIPSTIFQIPSNYPIKDAHPMVKSMSGMGTPDLLGTYGTFTYFTDQEIPESSRKKGGQWVAVKPNGHRIETAIEGPPNSFRSDKRRSRVPLTVDRDPREKVLRVKIADSECVLKEGEWSEWIPVNLEMIPFLVSTKGMVRLFAKQVHPGFELYCSPLNVDPIDPSLPICSPADFSHDVAIENGRFYTQGFPADTKARSTGALSSDEFLSQAHLALDESCKNYEQLLRDFDDGMFFFYFSSIDQGCHMLLHQMNEKHRLYDPKASPEVKGAIRNVYQRMDWALARALEKVDSNTLLIALSDHGFTSFQREFNASTYLMNKGYTRLTSEDRVGQGDLYQYVDWLETKAYALGLNGIYLNLRDREKYGIVEAEEVNELKQAIIKDLEAAVDPVTGAKPIVKAYDTAKIYTDANRGLAPDIVIGYNAGYRISDEAVIGQFPKETITNRTDPWASDHCVDPSVVPGVLFINKTLKRDNPAIWELAPSILSAFGCEKPKSMSGESVI